MSADNIQKSDNIPRDEPLVSVLIPCYNSASYISETLDSVIAQTYTNWECIIVDDHSTDNSIEIIKFYCKKHQKRIKLYSNKRKGACAARNFAAEQCTGQYLQFLDSDDILSADKIKKQMSFNKNKNEITFCNNFSFTENIINSKKSKPYPEYLEFKDLIFNNIIITSMVIISKDAFLMTGGFDENLKKAQEHDLNLRLSTNGFKFKYVNFHGVYSRIHHSPYRISNQKLAGTEINEFYFFDKIKKYINQYSNKKEHQRKCLIELIKLVIFRSQQFGNSKLFLIVEKFEEYINILKNGNNLKNKEICYKGKIYNFLLFNIGLTTFEKLRQIPNKLRS